MRLELPFGDAVTQIALDVEPLDRLEVLPVEFSLLGPQSVERLFTTAADMQTSVTVHVYQGERPMAAASQATRRTP